MTDGDKKLVEEWKPIRGYGFLYQVSTLGRVRSIHARWLKPRMLAWRQTMHGYLYVGLTGMDGIRKNHFVHRLVLQTFVGSAPKEMQAAHLDGNKRNNSLENLKWATRAENESHKKKHGTLVAGEKHPQTRISTATVNQIKQDAKSGLTPTQISRKYNYSRSGVGAILAGRSRRHG